MQENLHMLKSGLSALTPVIIYFGFADKHCSQIEQQYFEITLELFCLRNFELYLHKIIWLESDRKRVSERIDKAKKRS